MNKIKVSLVEDCLLSRITIKNVLKNAENLTVIKDYSFTSELIKELKECNPDVVLMDLDLKDINGIEATRILKDKFPFIKVIILTAHSGKDFFNASISAGANGFLLKSSDLKKLPRVIEAVHFGAFWFDSGMNNLCRENFPKPDSLDLWHLYRKDPISCDLTARELEVLKLLAEGKTNGEIAKEIIVSINTAKAHVGKILYKMHAQDRVQAAVMAVKMHLI